MRRYALIDGNLATSGLVEHRHFRANAERRVESTHQQAYIIYVHTICDVVVGDIIRYLGYVHTIAHANIVECGIGNTGLALQSAGAVEHTIEASERHVARKVYIF